MTYLLKCILGKITWTSPAWIDYLRQKAKTAPKLFFGTCILIAFMLFVALYAVNWYRHLPKPQWVTANITAPDITPLSEDPTYNPEPSKLTIEFGIYSPQFQTVGVAPLSQINQQVEKGVTLNPTMRGVWVWESDKRLVFTPAEDWPAGTSYKIQFAKDFFAREAKMEAYSYSFATKPFVGKLAEFSLYQNPVDPNLREAVATIDFNFPVDSKSLESTTRLVLETEMAEQSSTEPRQGLTKKQAFPFTYQYDKAHRRAFLHSNPLEIKNIPRYMALEIGKGVQALGDTDKTKENLSAKLLIPDANSYFKLQSLDAAIIRNKEDRPEQIITLEMTLGLTEKAINKSLHVYLLPKDKEATKSEKEAIDYAWTNPGEVSEAILAQSSPIMLKPIPTAHTYANRHSFTFTADANRYLFVKLDKGTVGFGGFPLANNYLSIIKVPEYPKEISFLHKGALLALSSEKKVSVLVRGLSAVKFNIARVLANNINQLVTQTEGDFNNPYFMNQSFNQQNISEIFSEIRPFNSKEPSKQNYTSLDLEKYLATPANNQGNKGLFLLQAMGWDEKENHELDAKTSRLILVTDLGLIVKDNSDNTHDVFVQSIVGGQPVADAEVSILGKNGEPIATRMTDLEGHAVFPNLKDYIEDREPTVYLARKGEDLSFIPYNKLNRQLNFSKFDIGGQYNNNQDANHLSAFLFSDRGIYRPGDKVHIAMILKAGYVQRPQLKLPLQVTITDPRGTTVVDEKKQIDETGLLTLDFDTNANSLTGQYSVMLYTVKDDRPDNYLGTTSFRVAEFQPDKMRIRAKLTKANKEGWISPQDLSVGVNLWNLYGAPAANRNVTGQIVLKPEAVKFEKYPDYVFADPLLDTKKPAKTFTDTLSEVKTNEQGEATLRLNLEKFEKATYNLSVFVEGFEAEGGRSVATQVQAEVSPRPYFVGFKADGDFSFIKQNETRTVHFITINPQLEKQALSNLKMQLVALNPVSTLIKKDNGTYAYESIIKSTLLETKPLGIMKEGLNYELPTNAIGDFQLTLVDEANLELAKVAFSVVGASQRPLPKNAELQVTLNKEEYQAGEDIELQITSPYTGAGLITIERDKLYKTQWFKADTTNSIQHIQIPEDFKGNGYINVTFVRDWNSPEIFLSPLSYSVLPFKVNHAKQDMQITLVTPKLAEPGEPYTIRYKSEKPGKMILYAVDEGILQVSKYHTPDPLAFFFQKRALEVTTQQTLDQILPNYVEARELSAVGGDEGEDALSHHLNPFKRKTDLPVVYWSGIVDTDSSERDLSFPIPDYFNGSLRVMAVGVSDDALGHAESLSEIKGTFVINPNVPTFVAPEDNFEISVSLANNLKGSGNQAKINIELNTSPELQVIGSQNQTMVIPEGREGTYRFQVKATGLLGSANLSFKANLKDKSSTYTTTLSVRPASPFMTSIQSGFTKKSQLSLQIHRKLYKEYRKVEAATSSSPLILVLGLQTYLNNYPFGCTEQLISKAFPLLVLGDNTTLSFDKEKIGQQFDNTVRMLSARQMSNGSFSFWPQSSNNENNSFVSVYAMHFLTEALSKNMRVPNSLLYQGIAYLKELAAQNTTSLEMARNQAYAIYILTRNEIVTSAYLTNLQYYLENNQAGVWKKDILAAYIASSYQLLKNSQAALSLISAYIPANKTMITTDFYNASTADAQYLYLLANHFPEQFNTLGDKLVMPLVLAINSEEMNTILSSYISIALNAYAVENKAEVKADRQTEIIISEIMRDKAEHILASGKSAYQKVQVSEQALSLSISNPEKETLFYQLLEAGFDKPVQSVQNATIQQGIEIFREYRDAEKKTVQTIALGGEIEVHLRVRALDNRYLTNIAIVDLLPGGFEVISGSIPNNNDYTDVREDRVVFFTSLSPDAKEIVYRIKATNTGTYTVPGVFAESMYNPALKARAAASTIQVK